MRTRSIFQAALAIALLLVSTIAPAGETVAWRSAPPGDRRAAIVSAAMAGDLDAARYLVQAGLWEEMAGLDPEADAIKSWKNRADSADGIAAAQVYAEILANWAVRHEMKLGKKRMLTLMREARDILLAHPLDHPVIAEEAGWLCRDVPPALKRSRELRLRGGDLFDRLPVPQDPLLATRWFLVKAKQGGHIEVIDDCLRQAVESAENSKDTAALAEALQTWITDRTKTLANSAQQVEYDAQDVLALYARLDAVLERRQDALARAGASWRCGRFVVGQRRAPQAVPFFSFAAKVYGERGDTLSQGRCLLEQLACLRSEAFLFGEERAEREKETLALARQAIACFQAAKEDAHLAQAHHVLGELLPPGSDEAIAEFRSEAALLNALGQKAQAGRALLSLAHALAIRSEQAREGQDRAAADRLDREEFSLRVEALALTKGSPPDNLVAYGTEQLGWNRLALHPEQLPQAIANLREASTLWGIVGDSVRQVELIESVAHLCAERGLPLEAQQAWRALGDLAYARRDGPEGAAWIERAAEYYAKSGMPDPPVRPLVIDEQRDETQGRQAARLHELCQAVAAASDDQQAGERLTEIGTLLGCTVDTHWINGLADLRRTWMLSRADCTALLRTARIRRHALPSADLMTQLGRRAGAEVLAAAMPDMPHRDRESAWVMTALVYALERTDPELAKRHLSLALEHLTLDGLRLALRLLPEDGFHRVLMRGLGSPVWEVKIHALRILNRTPEVLDDAVLERMALDPIPIWGHRVEALHGLILRGNPVAHAPIRTLIGDGNTPRDVRHLAIKGAAYLHVRDAEAELLPLLADPVFRAAAACALTHLDARSHLDVMRTWLGQPLDDRFDERHVVAHVALWSLLGEVASRDWLVQGMERKRPEFIELHVMHALGWSRGERAATLFAELITQRKFGDNWFGPNANRDNLHRSLSRLPLTAAQITAVERILQEPISARCMDKSTLSDDTLDKKPQAPWLKPRTATVQP